MRWHIAAKFWWLEQECTISENNIGRTGSSNKSPRLWTRGFKVGFNDVAPTIPSKKKIHMVGLKISLQSSEEEELVIKGQLCAMTWSKAQLYEEIQE
jgi:hypothetical protein